MEGQLRGPRAAGRNPRIDGKTQEVARAANGYDTLVRAYLDQLLGPDRALPAVRRALAELAARSDASAGRSPDAAGIRRVARDAGLDVLDADARRLRSRIAQAAHGRIRCTTLVRRLRDQAEGTITGDELAGLYRHVERCLACADLVARFGRSEWNIQVELPVPTPTPRIAEDLSTGQGHPPPPASLGPTQSRRQVQPRLLAIPAVLVVLAGVGVFLAGRGSNHPARPAASTRTARSATPPVVESAHGLRTPFELAGARFAVFENPNAPWTRFAARVSAGAGSRWELVTVRVRNLTRTGFDPRVLHYRLISVGGASYFPNLAYGTGPDVRRPPGPFPPGALVQAELAFQVPVTATRLQLAFDPTTGGHERVVVALTG